MEMPFEFDKGIAVSLTVHAKLFDQLVLAYVVS